MMDGSLSPLVEHCVTLDLSFGPFRRPVQFAVFDTGKEPLILGLPWLEVVNPRINFTTKAITFRTNIARSPVKNKDKTQARKSPLDLPEASQSVTKDPIPYRIGDRPQPQPQPQSQPEPQPLSGEKEKISVRLCGARHFRRLLRTYQAGILDVSRTHHVIALEASLDDSIDYLSDVIEEVPSEFHEFHDVFDHAKADELPEHRPYDHHIPLEEGTRPPYGPLYPLSPSELETLKNYIDDNLKSGFIRPSESPAAAPILFVKKKDGSLRLCVDYRGLNRITIKNRYPLPLIHELLNRLSSARYFSKIDLRNAYHQIRIAEGDEWKTAFRTRYGLYEYQVMPFGLTNAPASFQALVNTTFHDMVDQFVIVYLDDILIFSNTREEHEEHVRRVLQRLREAKLYAKPSKCEFYKDHTEFLGYLVSIEGISMDPSKVASIVEWPVPQTLKDLRSFLGFANFYRHFIQDYSKKVLPLTNLTKTVGVTKFAWSEEAQRSFEVIKDAFAHGGILRHYEYGLPCRVETDASDKAIGAILSQQREDKWIPVAFYSRKLIDAEINYEIHDKELLAIVAAVREWRHYLEGALYPVQVLTDHQPLMYLATKRQPGNRRQARWMIFLEDFNLEIKYRPGKQSTKPDALSRRPDYMSAKSAGLVWLSNLLAPRGRRLLAAAGTIVSFTSQGLQEDIRLAQDRDEYAQDLKKRIQSGESIDKYSIDPEENTLRYNGRWYVPEGPLRLRVVQQCHDVILVGHTGQRKTLLLASRNFYWPNMRDTVQEFVNTCHSCARSKTKRHKPYGLLKPLPIPGGPWQWVSIDYVEPLPVSNGFNSILVIVDMFTKMVHFEPTYTTSDAAEFSRLFIRSVVARHGLPTQVVSDRGSKFTSLFWGEVTKALGIDRRLSTSHQPQTDGQTERTNQTLEEFLRAYTNYNQDNWSDLLPMAEFAVNNSYQASIKTTPFFLNYGFHPRYSLDLPPDATAHDHLAAIERVAQEAKLALEEAKVNQTKYYNQKRIPSPEYKVGDKVWLSAKYLATDQPLAKLSRLRVGPLKILEKISSHAYRVQLPQKYRRTHNVFHVHRLEPCQEDPFADEGREQEVPPPTIIDGEEEWLVEAIVDARHFGRKHKVLKYKVKWVGQVEPTWEPVENVGHAEELVNEFYQRYPDKPRPA